MNKNIYLPGIDKQIKFFLDNTVTEGLNVLVIGAGSEEAARSINSYGASKVILIVEENEALLNSRLQLAKTGIGVRLMDFENTDFKNSEFDIIYAQASISNRKRNKIVKEFNRIIKPAGYFCVGEIISLTQNPPQFIKDIWQTSNLTPLFLNEPEQYYSTKYFEIVKSLDLSYTLKDFYSMSIGLLKENLPDFSEQEKSYYKKLFNRISHESNAYLKLGGDKYMGFKAFILRKKIS
jgi:ubiquinone/menaquinone biosynthesis C-methylase UbiE